MSTTALPLVTGGRSAALTPDDRCDRCGVQAYVRVELLSGGELLFCGHHAHEYGPELRKLGVAVHDETGCLLRTSPA